MSAPFFYLMILMWTALTRGLDTPLASDTFALFLTDLSPGDCNATLAGPVITAPEGDMT